MNYNYKTFYQYIEDYFYKNDLINGFILILLSSCSSSEPFELISDKDIFKELEELFSKLISFSLFILDCISSKSDIDDNKLYYLTGLFFNLRCNQQTCYSNLLYLLPSLKSILILLNQNYNHKKNIHLIHILYN